MFFLDKDIAAGVCGIRVVALINIRVWRRKLYFFIAIYPYRPLGRLYQVLSGYIFKVSGLYSYLRGFAFIRHKEFHRPAGGKRRTRLIDPLIKAGHIYYNIIFYCGYYFGIVKARLITYGVIFTLFIAAAPPGVSPGTGTCPCR